MKVVVPLAIVAFIIICGIYLLESMLWTGMRLENGHSLRVGKYPSLERCQREVEKTGGWCGKGCRDYGSAGVADCDPLVAVPQVGKASISR